jgi:NAD(P)-dependent dehydrogenase (short-subunit alcohol dehydrogenase family)
MKSVKGRVAVVTGAEVLGALTMWPRLVRSTGLANKHACLRSDSPGARGRTRGQYASMAGLNTSAPGSMGVYSVSKHALVALSESLQVSLHIRGANVGVSVCAQPGCGR